jgi:hypothetical protein
MSISLPPKGDSAKKLGSYFAPLKVEAQASPNMTVQVAAGGFWTADTVYKEFGGGSSATITAPTADAKWVLITLTASGALSVINGTASASPDLPDSSLYSDKLPLAAIFVGDTTTAITNDMVYDLRPMWQIQPDSVSQSDLDLKASIVYVDNQVATKADKTGTSNADWTLNLGGAAISNSGIYIERGAGDVSIRFTEDGGSPDIGAHWEFTNDGSTWQPVGVSDGAYYTVTALNAGALDFLYYTQTDLSSTGVLDSRYYTETEIDAGFSAIGHTHVAADITDFPVAGYVETINTVAPVLGNVSLNINNILDVTNSGAGNKHVLVHNGTNYVNRFLLTDDLSDVDTTSTAPVTKDALMHNGVKFVNRPLIKSDISDFTGEEFLLTTNLAGDPGGGSPSIGVAQNVYGLKTFKEGIVVEQSLTVTGTDTSIQTNELYVTDAYIDINYGNTQQTSGIRIDRTGGSPELPAAIMQWDETAGQWEFGVVGNANPVLTGNHTQLAISITDFDTAVTAELDNNNLNTIQDVTYSGLADDNYLRYDTGQWRNRNYSTDFIAELGVNNLNTVQDVHYSSLAAGDMLLYGGSPLGWYNHVPVKTDISNFTEADYIHVTGNEAKTGNFTLTGDLTVVGGVGTTTTINSAALKVLDNLPVLNYGETGAGVTGGTSGIEIDRGTAGTNAFFYWLESAKSWYASHTIYAGSPVSGTLQIEEIAYANHIHDVNDMIDLTATATEINFLGGVTSNVQDQLDDKISRAGDTMDAAANLTFSATGEVLGLPATPSGSTAATSMAYVDAQITAAGAALHAHAVDSGSPTVYHMTSTQNSFLDALNLTGSPETLTAAHVNFLSNVTSNVQDQLDDKISRAGDTMDSAADLAFVGGGEVTGLPASPSATAAASKEYVDAQVARKIDRAGETGSPLATSVMDSGISLTFSGGGEVLGLPASPSATGAASKEYVDGLDSAQSTALHAHAIDTGSPTVFHVTSAQNTFLDALNISGSPETLTAAHVNFLSNVTSNVQDQLDLKANFVPGSPTVVGNLLMVASDGDMEDSTVAVNDSGTTTADLWTASKIDTTKADKVVFGSPLGTGNFAGLDANGNLTDSTSKAADFATAVHTHVAADVTDFSTAADARIAAAVFDDLSDITFAALADDDFLRYDLGTTDWVNVAASAVTEFVHTTGTESIAGVKTFSNNAIFSANVSVTGNLTVLGTTTFIDSTNLEVTDKNITVNKGYSGPTSGSTGAGLYIVRNEAGSPVGSPATSLGANLIWDDALENFKAGIEGSETELARVGLTVAQPAYDIQTGAGGSPTTDLVYTLTGAEWNIPTPAANHAAIQIFVNGIKQTEGAGKAFTVAGYGTGTLTVTFNAGSEPAAGTDVEFYGFGYIG